MRLRSCANSAAGKVRSSAPTGKPAGPAVSQTAPAQYLTYVGSLSLSLSLPLSPSLLWGNLKLRSWGKSRKRRRRRKLKAGATYAKEEAAARGACSAGLPEEDEAARTRNQHFVPLSPEVGNLCAIGGLDHLAVSGSLGWISQSQVGAYFPPLVSREKKS